MSNLPAVLEHEASPTLFQADSPAGITRQIVDISQELQKVIRSQGLAKRIGQSDYVQVEGWQLAGAFLGLMAKTELVEPLGDRGYRAVVNLVRIHDGMLVGSGDAICLRSEKTWGGRDEYALYSMAQTRATGKAYRQALGYVIKMAGFEPTPAEEMPADEPSPAHVAKPGLITRADAARLVETAKMVGMGTKDLLSVAGVDKLSQILLSELDDVTARVARWTPVGDVPEAEAETLAAVSSEFRIPQGALDDAA